MIAPRWIAVIFVLGIVLPSAAQDDWTGKRVILKKPGLRIGYSDNDGKQVYVADLTNLSYTVQKESEGFLRVTHRGETGWFAKNDALLPDEAIPYFTERVRLAPPTDSYPLAYLGWAHKERKEFDRALTAYNSAIAREPRADWFNNRGLIHLEMKKNDLALADFSEAVKRAPKFVMALENRAGAYVLLGKTGPALDDWNEVVRLEPDNAPARVRRAKIYIDQKNYTKAVEDLTVILKDDPKNTAALIERGQAFADLQKTDSALADFSAAIAVDPANPEPYLGRAQLYTDKKEYARALADIEAALKQVPTLVEARVARGWNLFLTGEFEKANGDFVKAIEMNPKAPGAYNSQAWLWATCPDKKFRDGKKAVEYAKKAVELTQGKEPAILDTQAAAHAEAGEFDLAIKVQEQVISQLAQGSELVAEARARLEKYRQKQPHRQVIEK